MDYFEGLTLVFVLACVAVFVFYVAPKLMGGGNEFPTLTPTPVVIATPVATAEPTPTPVPEVTPVPELFVRTNQVAIINGGFTPQNVVISQGMTVTWENQDGVIHEIKTTGGPENFTASMIAPRQSYSRKFTVAGIYYYTESRYLSTGKIKVE